MREPHLYGMLLAIPNMNMTYLWTGIAYTFEDAFSRARQQFMIDNEEILSRHGQVVSNPTLVLLNSQKLEDAMRAFEQKPEQMEMVVQEETRQPPEDSKSGLMQRIIKTKNKKMFDLYKDKFTKAEQKLINEKCKW